MRYQGVFVYFYTKNTMKKPQDYNVIANYTYPCPVCGVHGCSGEYYVIAQNRKTIVLDRSDFDQTMQNFLSKYVFDPNNNNKFTYEQLPVFLKDYNESKGWNWCDADQYPLDVLDFVKTLELLMTDPQMADYDIEICKNLYQLAQECITDQMELYISDF